VETSRWTGRIVCGRLLDEAAASRFIDSTDWFQGTLLPQRIDEGEHEAVLDAMQARLDRGPIQMQVRRRSAEHPVGTSNASMGATHSVSRRLPVKSTDSGIAGPGQRPEGSHEAHVKRTADRGAPCLIGTADPVRLVHPLVLALPTAASNPS
jgi:hypothetical protein